MLVHPISTDFEGGVAYPLRVPPHIDVYDKRKRLPGQGVQGAIAAGSYLKAQAQGLARAQSAQRQGLARAQSAQKQGLARAQSAQKQGLARAQSAQRQGLAPGPGTRPASALGVTSGPGLGLGQGQGQVAEPPLQLTPFFDDR